MKTQEGDSKARETQEGDSKAEATLKDENTKLYNKREMLLHQTGGEFNNQMRQMKQQT